MNSNVTSVIQVMSDTRADTYFNALMSIAVGKHLQESHNLDRPNMHEHFNILKKCRRKLECLIYEMLLIKERRPTLNTQADSIRAKLFN